MQLHREIHPIPSQLFYSFIYFILFFLLLLFFIFNSWDLKLLPYQLHQVQDPNPWYRCLSHVEDTSLKHLSQAGTIISCWGKTEEGGHACIPIGTSTIYTIYYRQHNFPHASSNHNLHLLSRNFLLHETKSWIQTNAKFISYRKNLVYKFLYSL